MMRVQNRLLRYMDYDAGYIALDKVPALKSYSLGEYAVNQEDLYYINRGRLPRQYEYYRRIAEEKQKDWDF